ncbi:unnamed protein product [Bursaphelenchus okinawaensis]|uniref:Protein kinase domain-containing protein n=1 Tax=Bursaphelenchus okinawaensis TaxID=465554 RepID=A0A811LPH0_9BILA|nr:unnamed protein product [Bursaphelenchus okinawaensis]CAG9127167.1 unnamed protein product [Bursaphelenchus okinawaensis]
MVMDKRSVNNPRYRRSDPIVPKRPRAGLERNDSIDEILRMKTLHDKFRSLNSKHKVRYSPIKMVGKGGFGQVFECTADVTNSGGYEMPQVVALKTETGSEIKLEMKVLLKLKNHNHFCELYDFGQITPGYSFIVMTLLGPNLSTIRKKMPTKQFTVSTSIRAGLQMLMAIEALHGAGFISRDVKPSNFAIGRPNGNRRMVYMIDFGISLVYKDQNGPVKLKRSEMTWRGTNRYCSLGHHKKHLPSPKDDVESWFYSLMELCVGELPWQYLGKHQKAETCKAKEVVRTTKREYFLGSCPFEFDQILGLIDRMTRDSIVEYHKIYASLTRCLIRDKVDFKDPYDWEYMLSSYQCSSSTAASSDRIETLDKSLYQ